MNGSSGEFFDHLSRINYESWLVYRKKTKFAHSRPSSRRRASASRYIHFPLQDLQANFEDTMQLISTASNSMGIDMDKEHMDYCRIEDPREHIGEVVGEDVRPLLMEIGSMVCFFDMSPSSHLCFSLICVKNMELRVFSLSHILSLSFHCLLTQTDSCIDS